MMKTSDLAKQYLRPLQLSILFAVLGELIILIVWGVILYPEGSLLQKFLWTIVFCGLGMGSSIGALIDLFIVGKFKGFSAVVLTTLISVIFLGVLCNVLCYRLDMHFDYFGGKDTPTLFLVNGIFLSAGGGALVGWLCFSHRGRLVLEKLNL